MRRADDYEAFYASGDIPWDSETPSEPLVRLLEAGCLPGKTVLELGCGTGTNALEFARRGRAVTAVDSAPSAIRLAREKARRARRRVDFRVADALSADLGGPYDIVFDSGLYHHLRHHYLDGFLAVLKTATRPGSRYLCLAGDAGGLGPEFPGVHEHQIRHELTPLFEVVILERFEDKMRLPYQRCLPAWSILLRRRKEPR